ncbi:uncharacterized protein LOC125728617 isoform X1 [Brienomyrus brachyistius]|uniref:uncharacterized protein LOC125728617 isoform X1 n=1 Tax=Brienomyrus brachyistius TaxID=42636 RepID=UPI0020B194D2|nr:uncharacterized protein LOC125728617 isoform X1 [Brienomyrus brachyistius]XP_048861464.1 uncharacterized protein LOC125728617 isoform X1 [Brienomyrus brachyistius]XP_048861465.1 uncharacterized protein LOC125728617 isoform X1 [Brienomyrus brachyistius]XP_048861466.1 uncharacterized protein LOC125728617 isoform X1 [Brienomyrus brachyistius]XP_048861467.1 uncharacterized protein LOC125728617 isoform X1 [Brienomyrus brachyistius]
MATAGGPSRKPFSGPWLVAGGGLRNTARFCWRAEGEVGTFPDRLAFIREVAFKALGLRILCVQRNGPFQFFEVTLSTDDSYSKVLERSKEGAQHPLLGRYNIEPLWWPDKRVITVHCFNPHITAEANGAGGFSHPPAYFTLQGNKAYLFYSGQPPFCRQCHSFGHTLEGCANLRCRNCLESGHMARDCKGPRRCIYCNSEDHLARSCPQRKTTYADALSGNRAVGSENGGGALAPTTGQEQPATGAGGEALVEVEEAPSSATPMQEGSPNKVEQLALAPGVSSRRKKSVASPRGRKKSRREAQPDASSPPAASSPAVAAGDQGRQCPPSPMLEAPRLVWDLGQSPAPPQEYSGQQDTANEQEYLGGLELGDLLRLTEEGGQ